MPGKGDALGSSLNQEAWTSPKADEYAEDLKGLVNQAQSHWNSCGTEIDAEVSEEPDMVDDEVPGEAWKARWGSGPQAEL